MKNYRNLVPIILILLMVVSIYTIISDATIKKKEVDEKITQAENCISQELYDKAANIYDEVILIDNQLSYYLRVIDMYFSADDLYSSEEWCENALNSYPKSAEVYERLINIYITDEEYKDAFIALDECSGKKVNSETIEKYRKKIEFTHFDKNKTFDYVAQSSSGYVAVKKKEKWGLANTSGSLVVSPRFDDIGYFANGMVPVLINGVWYMMNESGEYVYNLTKSIDGKITDIGLYNSDVIPICVNGVYSYYDLNFKKKFGEYDFAGSFSSGVAAVKDGESWFLIDTSGKLITEVSYENVILDDRGICCQKERIFAKVNNQYILLDAKGNKVNNNNFDDAKLFTNGDYAAVEIDGLWGFVDTNGEVVISPIYFDAKSFSLGLASVTTDGELWGYIDASGNEIIEDEYIFCYTFTNEGSAFVQEDGNDWKILKLYKYNYN